MELVETERLRLERWRPRHTEALAQMNAEPEVMRYVGDGRPASAEASRAQSARFAGHWERFGFGLWAVFERAGAEPVGFAGLSHPLWFPEEIDNVEVGWRFRRSTWGRGYATEAGAAGVRAAFEALGRDGIVSYIHPDNERSRAVAERLGMCYARDATNPKTGRPIAVYELDREAYEAAQGR